MNMERTAAFITCVLVMFTVGYATVKALAWAVEFARPVYHQPAPRKIVNEFAHTRPARIIEGVPAYIIRVDAR